MLSYQEYISITKDPQFDDGNDPTQLELTDAADLQYRIDMLVKEIGTPQAKYNYDLVFNELVNELDKDMFHTLFYRCMIQFIIKYRLLMIRDKIVKSLYNYNEKKVLEQFFTFFEKGGYIKFVAGGLPTDDVKDFKDENLLPFLKLHYKEFLSYIKRVKDDIPLLIYYHLINTSSDNLIWLLYILIQKNKSAIIAEQIVQKYGGQNDNN